MPLGLLRAFREAGIDVPGRVSVAGFDDIPEAEYFYPPLTTVRQDFAEVGRRSIALLLDQLTTGEPAAPRVVAPARLVVRSSTGERSI
jgi:DNA-binding LacI/PurR family transcriptional regulator